MTKPILVVGAGPAGLAASHALAQVGQPTILVEKEDTLGGAPILSGYAKLVPSDEWAKAVDAGRWPSEVRPFTRNRRHVLKKLRS